MNSQFLVCYSQARERRSLPGPDYDRCKLVQIEADWWGEKCVKKLAGTRFSPEIDTSDNAPS